DQPDKDIDEPADADTEVPDVDMYCPLPMDAKYPYYRKDGTIHFCRPCDKPDEYDPQCVKSLWKDLNKEVYDSYKNGEFEDNELIAECYPWPCEWNVTPTSNELVPLTAHQKCDIFLNPRTWANSFSGFRKEANMDGGKILFQTDNYRIGDKKPIISDPGYAGQRAVLYDIKTGKYTVIGKSIAPFFMADHIFINPYITINKKGFKPIVDVIPYKFSYKYNVIFTDEDTNVSMDVYPYVAEKWTIMVANHLDNETDPVGRGNRSLVYAKTGDPASLNSPADSWKWTTLAYGNPDGKADELSISGNRAMFYHYGTNASWVCDLSKNPKKITDCKRIGKENEVAGFPKFDLDNPDRIIYRPIAEGIPRNHFVIMNISKDPWTLEKEFDIPTTEKNFINLQLAQVKSNVMLYKESYQMEASGYQTDGKLCYYRIDKEKVYCSKPIEGQTSYGHGFTSFEGKYLFWQPAYKAGYILRDMDCYCKEEGICPFEE
ncbi:MAG TPA: hypothetical protein P5044_02910, partial [bacterium]|nr:hypothetical protein [bacterium]